MEKSKFFVGIVLLCKENLYSTGDTKIHSEVKIWGAQGNLMQGLDTLYHIIYIDLPKCSCVQFEPLTKPNCDKLGWIILVSYSKKNTVIQH